MKPAQQLRDRLTRLLRRSLKEDVGPPPVPLQLDWPEPLVSREVLVHVPADGARAETPVLLALDGQTMPAWRLAETLAMLHRAGEIAAPLVVAVPASADRVEEYALAARTDHAGRGRLAPAFQRFLADTVLPAACARHGVRPAPARTGVFGASMGGLCAFDLAWHRPDLFGFAGVFSGSLWWRGDDTDAAAQQASRLAHAQVRAAAARPALRLWFQAGTADETADRDGDGVIDAIQDTTELIGELERIGFRRGEDVVYREVPGGMHHESTWAEVLPEFLHWALPPR